MATGAQPTEAQVNNTLTSLSLQLRDLMGQIAHQQAYLNKLGTGGLTALGFLAADAQDVLNKVNNMGTVAGVYKGTVQQGGTGGTGATLFSFEDALTNLWGGN